MHSQEQHRNCATSQLADAPGAILECIKAQCRQFDRSIWLCQNIAFVVDGDKLQNPPIQIAVDTLYFCVLLATSHHVSTNSRQLSEGYTSMYSGAARLHAACLI